MPYCKDCAARSALLREAAFEGRLAAAMGHAIKGAAEMVGLKDKTGAAELDAAKREEVEARLAAASADDPALDLDWPTAGLDPSEDGPEAED